MTLPRGGLTQVAAAAALGKFKRGCYGAAPVASAAAAGTITPAQPGGAAIDRVQIREELSGGQLVRNFTLVAQVRRTPSWPRSWANFSLF